MKKSFFAIIFISFFSTTLFGQSATYWQQKVNYLIDVTLNDKDNSLDGYVKMEYFNNSPDTLRFIWIHIWPNGYKNDKTAFSEQLLENGRTDFYFSDKEKRGYINRLDFKTNGAAAEIEDHPTHQDIIQLNLTSPLLPNTVCKIETPFHVQLPFNFSRGGYNGESFQITQWYPKPAVYDKSGWHEMPYLDQGEFYSEFGNYEVRITLPENYVVAATGELQTESEINWLQKRAKEELKFDYAIKQKLASSPKKIIEKELFPKSSTEVKTIIYKQDNIHDFAWFADKRFAVQIDTLQLSSGRTIATYNYYVKRKASHKHWQKGTEFIKKAIRTRSEWIGEYPYNTVSVVEAQMGFSGGMEYPTITSISPVNSEVELENTIQHEIGHNWHYGILATNERLHPWMDEGFNTFYDNRYTKAFPTKAISTKTSFFKKRIPADVGPLILQTLIKNKKDQPIETSSEAFSEINYFAIGYQKTADWLLVLEDELGKPLFDKCMQTYYEQWKFKHPTPEDFKAVVEKVSGKNVDATFALLNKKGSLTNETKKKGTEVKSYFNLNNPNNKNQIFVAPMLGYNFYDKLMFGAAIHNYTLPQNKFQFLAIPLYATNSKQLNGIGRLSYTSFLKNSNKRIDISLSGASFSQDSFTDSANNTTYFRFSKIVPSVRVEFGNKDPRSHVRRYIQWKTFFINQKGLLFTRDTVNNKDVITYPTRSSYINQLKFVHENNRKLYPYHGDFVIDQGKDFIRFALTGNYFLNYAKGGGMNVRFFFGKFVYLTDNTFLTQYNTDPYHLNMTGPKGYEDYTYSNYYIGRNEFEKISSQQIMIRDGAFKVRTDLLSAKIGKTDNWLSAVNFTTDVPKSVNPLQMLPFKLPLKAFLDIGTYADAWEKNASTGRFIYDAGLQLSVLKNTVQIYIPILYSKVYSDYFKSTIPTKRFWKNISFSIDIQNFSLKKIAPQIPF